jgi:hypothetical protein
MTTSSSIKVNAWRDFIFLDVIFNWQPALSGSNNAAVQIEKPQFPPILARRMVSATNLAADVSSLQLNIL